MRSEVIESPSNMRSSIGTSAGGSLVSKSLRVIVIAGALSIPGTVSTGASAHMTTDPTVQTNGGVTVEMVQPASNAIMELRRLSGMTWDQLARLFGVARRTLHFWASGKALNAGNEERLHRMLATIRRIDRGSARANRDALFTAHSDGALPFDLLQAGKYGDVIDRLGEAGQRKRPRLSPLSPQARSSRVPMKPADLANALQDTVHRDVGRSRVARTVRTRRTSHGDET